ncbi:MAG TPA: RsmE family RNA methyltransferase [Thermoanaerobaculia bacterium]|nr:RsmE family RNA methyltransferase [Thermoanaerobaculia bacterium]
MRHRIYVDRIEPEVTVTGDEFHHSVRVVRVRAGEEVELFDAHGNVARATVESVERDRAVIRLLEPIASRESPLEIHLAMAIIQLDKFELVLQKATELGVRSFIPLVTDRVELRPERYFGKGERWERIVFEAVKQSGRSVTPSIEPAARFEDVVARAGTRILFDADAPPSSREPVPPITLLIGPEGGWSEDEIRLAREHGCWFERLGPRRLRAETAAIAAAAILGSRFGDL